MTTWTLVIYIYAGMMASGDSVALTNISGFATEQSCSAAGEKSKAFVKGSAKELRYVCLEGKRNAD